MGIKTITLLGLITFCMATAQVSAQPQTTHTVKEGETLQSIAKKYSLTPYSLLRANPELQKASDIKANTLLIIPSEGTGVVDPTIVQEETEAIEKPIGFIRHKVRKKETLFSLTRRYRITEEELKRYNPQLYAEPLKKKMILKIPRYPKSHHNKEEMDVETYIVQPKETRWSIAHKYGITIDSLVALNPQLAKNPQYLGVGQPLKLPRSKQKQTLILFTSYTVSPKTTLYSLGKTYNIPPDSILQLNPEVVKAGGLKTGMVLRLPKPQEALGVVNTENYIFYEVKPKQTLFGLTKTLKISREELFRLNPALENGLKAGMVLKLPKENAKNLEIKNALVLDKINLLDSIRPGNKLNLVFMLPFRLDRVDVNDPGKTQDQLTARKDLSLSLGFYSGALVALDSIKKLGVSVAVRTYDTELSRQKVKEILIEEDFSEVNAIIGPLAPDALNEVALATVKQNIPVIAPVTSDSRLGYSNIFFSVPQEEILQEKMFSYLRKSYAGQNIILIADKAHTEARKTILQNFPHAKNAALIEDKSLHLRPFVAQISRGKENWVFLETKQPGIVASVTSVLNSLNTEKTPIRLFTTNYSNAFETEALSPAHLSNLNFTYPSFYKEGGENSFVKAYEKRFNGLQPHRYAFRGFDLTFDILVKLAHKNNLFETSKIIGLTEYTANRFEYFNNWPSGYYNKACYLLQYNDLKIKEIPLNDFESNL